MEEFYFEESNPKQVFTKILVILFVFGIGIGIFLYIKSINTFKLKDLNINLGEELSSNVEDYVEGNIKNIKDYKLYINDVDVNKVGEYYYKVKYNKHIEKGKVNVVDNKVPVVTPSEDIVVGVDEDFDVNMLIAKCEDDSLPCSVELKKESDLDKLKKEGTYKIDIIVSDAVGNKTDLSVEIRSSSTETMSSLQSNDLNYYTNSENDDNINHTLFIVFDKAIGEDSHEYEGAIHNLSSMDFSEFAEEGKEIYDVKLITAYNKYSYVIGFQVLVTYTDGTNELLEKGD